jgi:SPASM domain peptide maturase of grasp-with-spasm system
MPYHITNSIIELDEPQNFSLNDIIHQLDELGCRSVQLRFLKSTSLNKLSSIIKYFKNSRINETEILFPAESDISEVELHDLLSQEKRISKFLVYNSIEDKVIKNQAEFYNNRIIYFKKDIRVDDSEIISKSRFRVNIKILSEAQKFNLGLNRKVCIDRKGQIKNYIGHMATFGNINENPLESVISEKFKEMWLVSNDQIEGCVQCQYRYVCVSNSELKKSAKGYVKLEKCAFDPYTNIWTR